MIHLPTRSRLITVATVLVVVSSTAQAVASTPTASTLGPPTSGQVSRVSWTGGPMTAAAPFVPAFSCDAPVCDNHDLTLDIPVDFWDTRDGAVVVDVSWTGAADDFDVWVEDANGRLVKAGTSSAVRLAKSEQVNLGELAPGRYRVQVAPVVAANGSFAASATLTVAGGGSDPMVYPETRAAVEDELVQEYPLNVVFVGRDPSPTEIAELRANIPDKYRPTVARKSTGGGNDFTQAGAPLLNWNQSVRSSTAEPYFLGITYKYKLNVFTATDDYAKALFQAAEDNTAAAQEYRSGKARTQNQVAYDAKYGGFRVQAKGNDPSYKVTDPTKTDLLDAFAVEDWIFDTRLDARWACAFRNAETNACADPSVIQPDRTAYHDPFYDKDGLNLDRMPQGLNNGSSFFFLDTFTPDYAKDYFRPNAYHTWGTDKVIGGKIVRGSVDEGGSWRITNPDTGAWAGIDFARTWGGRYRFHFIDIGAAPNDFESATWAGNGLGMSSDYPHGDPPVWQYEADPLWRQPGSSCLTEGVTIPSIGGLPYRNTTPCRIMPRLARDVAYGLFFRSTPGYLYRPIPRGDVNWLAVSNWTDFYSRPQWVNGALTNGGGVYGTWWSDLDKLYKIGHVDGGRAQDDVLRWLSSATPYARWVGRKGEVIPLYDPTNNQPTGKVLDTSPKYADLPAPEYHLKSPGGETNLVPEPLYHVNGGEHEHVTYPGGATVDLTEISNTIEKAKAKGNEAIDILQDGTGDLGLGTYDGSVSARVVRDYIDANPAGIAERVDGVNTIPSVNMVFEKAYTWYLPAIVGGVAMATKDGEAWGVLNNVNDRVKGAHSHYPGVQPGDTPGSKRSLTGEALPTQKPGNGMSYTVEHEAAHNLGLSHPHDGSYGVTRCPAGDPKAGQWECYWAGLGWMYDISAAPTTYAMPYRPYEVEDQDALQRGHVAEYLIGAQEALAQRLREESAAGSTTPSTAWTADFTRMKGWRTQAGELFRKGDYLHAEYAARNASLASRGFPQTPANTSDPKLVEAGQIWYFTVHPQTDAPAATTNLTVTDLSAAQPRPRYTELTARVANPSTVAAQGVVVEFRDGDALIATSAPVDLAAGENRTVTVTWDTKGLRGDRLLRATVDPANAIAESDETDNTLRRIVTVKGNRVTNGSFEEPDAATQPAAWSGSGTAYDTSGTHATDGHAALGLPGGLLKPATVSSAPIPVTAGQSYQFAAAVNGPVPSVSLTWLTETAAPIGEVAALSTTLVETSGVRTLTGSLSAPTGATAARITLSAPTSLLSGQTTWIDDVWMW